MWIITEVGFFSIVQKPEDKATGMLTVRSRVRSDLENLAKGHLRLASEISEDLMADYRYRAKAKKSDVAAALASLTSSIEYSNFKNRVAKVQGPTRAQLYGEVWQTLYGLQSSRFERNERSEGVAHMPDVGIRIIELLHKHGIAAYPGRPFDCSYELIRAKPSEKRLVIVGFNGSSADKCWTTESAVRDAMANPAHHEVADGCWANGKNGKRKSPLQARLLALPGMIGFDSRNTIYTNAILHCSRDATSLRSDCEATGLTHNEVVQNSLNFFEEFISLVAEPDTIILYGNAKDGVSTGRLFFDKWGNERQTVDFYRSQSGPVRLFSAEIGGKEIKVIAIPHMSRVPPPAIG